MKVLIVSAHFGEGSFNHSLVNSFKEGLLEAGHTAEHLDVVKDGFDPVLHKLDENLEDKVLNYQEKIKQADALAFIFPIYWYREPAALAGFFDKVFSKGFAFKYVPRFFGKMMMPQGLLPIKKVIVMETYGGPSFYYRFLVRQLPWKRIKILFRFCGIRKFIHAPCYSVLPSHKDELKVYLERAKKIGKKLK